MSKQAAHRRVTLDITTVDDALCTVLHVDMDAFFAAVELQRRPELVGRPMMVAGVGGRGVVLSATYEARAFGVRSAIPTAQGLARCPGIIVIPPDHQAYRDASRRLMTLLGDITPVLEVVSVDEAFLDVSGSVRRLGRPGRIAMKIREAVRSELGLTATVGAASTKFVAKLASSLAKPDGILIVPPIEVAPMLRALPVDALWGAGPRTAAKLRSCGFATVAEIADAPPGRLAAIVGSSVAHTLTELANGRDDRPVTPESSDVTIGTEQTFDRDVSDESVIRRTLLDLSTTAARRLRQAGHVGRTVVLKIRFDDFTTITRSESVMTPIDDDRDIYAAALRNWQRSARGTRSIRLLGVRIDNLSPAGRAEEQMTLGTNPDQPGWRAARQAVDALADRFGAAAPRPAALVNRPVLPPRVVPAVDRNDSTGPRT
ncbi:MAG: DNA polymerase IV [Nakamurella sp.]